MFLASVSQQTEIQSYLNPEYQIITVTISTMQAIKKLSQGWLVGMRLYSNITMSCELIPVSSLQPLFLSNRFYNVQLCA